MDPTRNDCAKKLQNVHFSYWRQESESCFKLTSISTKKFKVVHEGSDPLGDEKSNQITQNSSGSRPWRFSDSDISDNSDEEKFTKIDTKYYVKEENSKNSSKHDNKTDSRIKIAHKDFINELCTANNEDFEQSNKIINEIKTEKEDSYSDDESNAVELENITFVMSNEIFLQNELLNQKIYLNVKDDPNNHERQTYDFKDDTKMNYVTKKYERKDKEALIEDCIVVLDDDDIIPDEQQTKTDYENEPLLQEQTFSQDSINEEYICDFCHKRFDKKTALISHIHVHCYDCGKTFFTERKMRGHKTTMHTPVDKKTHLCSFCGRKFASTHRLNVHINYSHDRNNQVFPCNTCGKHFETDHKLKNHSLSHTKPFACDICDKKFTRSAYLKYHMYKHTKVTPYRCNRCYKMFSRPACLKTHQQKDCLTTTRTVSYKKLGNYPCDLCKETFSREYKLSIHKSIHKGQYTCYHCEKKVLTKLQLRQHIQSRHLKRFSCDICKKKFSYETYLNAHKLLHLRDKFSCDRCGKLFLTKYLFNRHMKSHTGHLDNNSKSKGKKENYACDKCDETFSKKLELQKHLLKHLKAEDLRCVICKKQYNAIRKLQNHRVYCKKRYPFGYVARIY